MRHNGNAKNALVAVKNRFFAWLLVFLGVFAMGCFALPSSTASAGELTAAPAAVSFGSVYVGQTSIPRPVTISTYFWAPIEKISTTGDFSQINNCPRELPLYGRCGVMITFSPAGVGLSRGLLTVTSRSKGTTFVLLSGTGAQSGPTSTVEPTNTPTPTMVPTNTPTPTPTMVPTNTPTPTATPTATPLSTTLAQVSGTATFGGTATLTATLSPGVCAAEKVISFALDGMSVGTAVTNPSGIATLSGVPTSDPIGTDPGGVAASFMGDRNCTASSGTGNLIVQ